AADGTERLSRSRGGKQKRDEQKTHGTPPKEGTAGNAGMAGKAATGGADPASGLGRVEDGAGRSGGKRQGKGRRLRPKRGRRNAGDARGQRHDRNHAGG